MRCLFVLGFLLALAPEALVSRAEAQTCPSPLATGDWSAVDGYALEASERDERDIKSLARYLQRAGRSDGARIRAAFRWTTAHIAYDVEALTGRRPSQSADTTFATRRGVCEGYARLLVSLLQEMDIESAYVDGWGLPESGSAAISPDGLHAWVAARAGRDWILMDPTWGAGGVARGQFFPRFNPAWFATSPDAFARTHIPTLERWQLLARPLSLTAAVAREVPEAACLRAPGETTRRNAWSSNVTQSDSGPPWVLNSGVRFRLLSTVPEEGYSAGTRAPIQIEVEGAREVAVFDGAVHNQDLRASGDVWSGRVRIGREPVRLAVRMARGEAWRMVASVHVTE